MCIVAAIPLVTYGVVCMYELCVCLYQYVNFFLSPSVCHTHDDRKLIASFTSQIVNLRGTYNPTFCGGACPQTPYMAHDTSPPQLL